MNIFNIYETGEEAENHSSIAYFNKNNVDNDDNYEERNCFHDQNNQFDINYTDGDNTKEKNQFECCLKDTNNDSLTDCIYGNSFKDLSNSLSDDHSKK